MTSAKVKALMTLYKHGRLTAEQLKASVPTVLTEEEYKEIVGEAT